MSTPTPSRRSTRLSIAPIPFEAIEPMSPVPRKLTAKKSVKTLSSSSPSVTKKGSTKSVSLSKEKKTTATKKRSAAKTSLTKKRRSTGKKRDSSDAESATEFSGELSELSRSPKRQSSKSPRRQTQDASTSSSLSSDMEEKEGGVRTTSELPLIVDVIWLTLFNVAAFAFALAAIHPERTLDQLSECVHTVKVLKLVLPMGDNWQIFMRCAVLFAIGAVPVRRWSRYHFSETRIPSDVMIGAVYGVLKLALIQFFMFKEGENEHQAAVLHASLGFAVQEFILHFSSVSFSDNLQRIIEMLGNSVILFMSEDDVSLQAMAYTLTTLTMSKVLRCFLVIASSKKAYFAFRRTVAIGHTVLLSIGIPFILSYLIKKAKENENDSVIQPTFSMVLTPIICTTVLLSSIVLSHLDLLFN